VRSHNDKVLCGHSIMSIQYFINISIQVDKDQIGETKKKGRSK